MKSINAHYTSKKNQQNLSTCKLSNETKSVKNREFLGSAFFIINFQNDRFGAVAAVDLEPLSFRYWPIREAWEADFSVCLGES